MRHRRWPRPRPGRPLTLLRVVCRDLPPLTHQLAVMTPSWTTAVAPVAEATAQAFLRAQSESGARIGNLPTLLTEANRRAGREATKRKGTRPGKARGLGLARACQECGVVLDDSSRKYCDACFPQRREAMVANFASAGPAALAKRRAEGADPADTKEARRKQGLRAAINMYENAEWERLHTSQYLQLDFLQDIQPALQCLPLTKIMDATGLSLRYSSLIRRGLKIPHRRHWAKLAQLVPDRAQLSLTKGEMTPLAAPTHAVTLASKAVESWQSDH
jgi:hypothetical protein